MTSGESRHYFIAPTGWDVNGPNPFTPDGTYGASWIALLIGDDEEYCRVYGRLDNGLFRSGLDRQLLEIAPRVADFVRYGYAHGWDMILAFPDDVDAEVFVRRALEQIPDGPVVREADPRWLVHSTTLPAWERIKKDGCLKSAARLENEGAEVDAMGLRDFREPSDFADYVMLSGIKGIGPEHVVASRAKGRVFTDEETAYVPGMRLYFDAHRIITDGLAVRDGIHNVKVRDQLPLHPYLVASVTTTDVDPDGHTSVWTPRSFHEAANAFFLDRHGGERL